MVKPFTAAFAAFVVLNACSAAGLPRVPSQPQNVSAISVKSAGTFRVLHAFAGGADGNDPSGPLTPLNGLLYGVAYAGGDTLRNDCTISGCGVVYSIDPSTGAEHVVHAFTGPTHGDGQGPYGPLVAIAGVLYGTTTFGGASSSCGGGGCGTVFAVTPSGQERTVYQFTGSDGEWPSNLLDGYGTLYGITNGGGGSTLCPELDEDGCGTIFSLTTAGQLHTLHVFSGANVDDGGAGGLAFSRGKLYGFTTLFGSSASTVYSMTPAGAMTPIYRFAGGASGGYPDSLIATNGVLYGTTQYGGAPDCSKTCGLLYKIDKSGALHVFRSFRGGPTDGIAPESVTIHEKVLYGVTGGGGLGCKENGGCGVLFAVHKSGLKYAPVHFFRRGDGWIPFDHPTFVGSTMYGTTTHGGDITCGCGTVYAFTPP